MGQSNWEADKMLDVYIYDYLLKRNLQATAKAFKEEGKVATDPVAIEAPGGFLFEWWSVFWDIFIARTNENHSQVAAAYIETQRAKAKEEHQKHLQMQQMHIIQQQQAQIQRRIANLPSHNLTISATNTNGISGPPTASLLAAKIYEERMKPPQSMDTEISPQFLDANRVALFKSATSNPGQFIQSNTVTGSAAMQLVQGQNQQLPLQDIKGDMSSSQRSLQMDPSSLYGHGIMQAKSGLGMNQGVNGLPLKGWPLTGLDQLRQNFGPQVNMPLLPNQSQFHLLSPNHQQQILAQAQAQSNADSSNYVVDPRRLRVLPRSGLSAKDSQLNGNDLLIGSPSQSSSPNVRQDQAITKMQQSSNQQIHELVQQQAQQSSRKRKPTSSGAANSTGTGNTVPPSVNSPPSTPSIHTPGDGVSMASNMQNMNSLSTMPKSLMMYGTDRTQGIASSSNQIDDLERFGNVGSLDDNVESFLSNDDEHGRDIFAALKSTADHNVESLNGFTLNEVGCIRTSSSKVVSCHFSSDGKLLGSAGHDKKVVLWNMDTLRTVSSSQDHSQLITNICFRPNSRQLATSSFDKTVRLWNAAESIHCLNTFSGHNSQVSSVDFHPKESDILCSCDDNGEIRYWSVGQYLCTRVFKGGSVQVKFQPRSGQFLAAVADNVISIFDVETNTKIRTLQGHSKTNSICWDTNGNTLASVSQDLVKIWTSKSWDCIHELSSTGNQFNSCVFHPRCPQILVIGGYQSLELWNMFDKQQTTTIQAHDGLISALTQSSLTGMIASASHDKCVKIWK